MSDLAIRVRGLTKRYGRRQALRQVDLEVPRGSFFALLGPNGAGKTTLMRCLTGFLRPDGGEGEVLGEPLGQGYPPLALKERLGYVPQYPALYDSLTVGEHLDLCRGVHPRWDGRLVQRYLDLFGLSRRTKVRHMSTGMRSQLALTLVMAGNPDLLILDEPTLGLDPLHRRQYLQVLLSESMETGRTILLSSHDLDQTERLCDRVAVLHRGEVAVSGPIDDLKEQERRARVAGDVTGEALLAVPGVRRVQRDGPGWLIFARGAAAQLEAALRQVPGVHAVQVFDQSLEEIFLSYVTE